MPDIRIDQVLLQTAIKALGITVPVYVAMQDEDGDVLITTRNGTLTWTPPKPKKRTTTAPRKSPGKKRTTTASGG